MLSINELLAQENGRENFTTGISNKYSCISLLLHTETVENAEID